ncbi:short chain dehydrogenase [Caulobacter flavus]|uniref:Short chain dehydrogenase n=1 Tax=Caulobacter flavus TaxID=1679497 RepID=A0A2N5CZ55_9CAUL|nr:SDR family oxidoreductase [Caulobacter flavus]AYV45220.1 short chain dehydrogenase [Caulobacter flavus]PLR19099.1 short chain dehydrogenase [Caulobacter flavus]
MSSSPTSPSPRGGALVTGAGRRIGRVLALEAARAGYDVAVHYRTARDEAEDVVAEIAALGRRAVAVPGELADPDVGAVLVGAASQAVGPLTLLVNSASTFEDDRVATLSADSWDRHMDANLRAPVLLAQAFAAALPAGFKGLVVNLVDQRVLKPNPQFFSYSVSKAGLWWATRTLAQDLAPAIRVNAIGPGPVLASVHQAPGEFEAEAAATPLGAAVEPSELAAAMRYLIDAPSVTGQMIAVDGGQHLAWRTPDVLGS